MARVHKGSKVVGSGGQACLLDRQFLTQTQSVSPSFTLSTGLFNQGQVHQI